MLPWPHAPETTGTTAYVVAPHRISQRFAPAGVASRPATRRNRHAPQSANGTASTSTADTAAAGLPPRTVASSAIGSTYGGAGTAVPSPSSCHDERCSDHQSLQSFGAGESPGPETCPSAERAPMSIASTVTASSTATGLVRKRATSPVSSTTSSSSSRSRSVVRRAANDDGSRSAAAARRRSATSEADWVSAVARSMTASRPCRYGSQRGASSPCGRRGFGGGRGATGPPGRQQLTRVRHHRDVRREVVEGRPRATRIAR